MEILKRNAPLLLCTAAILATLAVGGWQLHNDLRSLSFSLMYNTDAANAARSACQTRRQAMDQMCKEGAPGILAELCEKPLP